MVDDTHHLFGMPQKISLLTPSSVLDVGCGDGWLVKELRSYGLNATGVDPEVGPGIENIIQGSAENLPFDDASFDLIVSTFALHHYEDRELSLKEAARVGKRHILIVDQWYDPNSEKQRLGQEIGRWIKSVEQRHGNIHHFDLAIDQVQLLIEASIPNSTMEIETYPNSNSVPADSIYSDLENVLVEYRLSENEQKSLEILKEKLLKGSVGEEGRFEILVNLN